MKRFFLIILVLAVLGGGGYWWYLRQDLFGSGRAQSVAAAAASSAVVSPALAGDENVVDAIGRIVPARFRELHFRASGELGDLLVEEGQQVQEGEVLARLRDGQQMKLAVATASLEVASAEKTLADLERSAPLQAAQAFYEISQVKKELEKIQKRRTAMNFPRATKEELDDAYENYQDAEDKLKQVAEYYKATDDVYKASKAARDNALSTYNWLIGKYTDLDKMEVEANYQLNERKLADLERTYDIYSKGPDPEEVTLAQARLEVARQQLAVAEAAYEDLTLNAPFSGVIARMDLEDQQMLTAGQPVLTLADFSRWRIETEDLTELSVTQIQEGDPVEISIDAIPDKTFTGVVVDILLIGETRRGDITYTVVIELTETDPRLRWNMTSPVSIMID
jgi:multidrug efflux pump subunit AcrA (membrane-fusion protein)